MKGLKTLRLGLAGIAVGALLLAGGLLLASQASAISGSLGISSGTAAPGAQTSVDLSANVGTPGLGAWTVDIGYTVGTVSVVSCSPQQGGVCNPNYGPGKVRITGASASGLLGNTTLGTITFMCGSSAGTSALSLSVEVFADATIGAPRDIDETVSQGSVSCAVAPTAGPAAATATPIIRIGDIGNGGPTSGSDFSWLIASLAAAGVIALAGYGALRVRTRNS
jgi:hypothetical protein